MTPDEVHMQPNAGARTLGKYTLRERVGVGGMAEVWRATLTTVDGFEKTVAIKRMLQPYGDNARMTGLFISEARVASALHHPNITQIYELGQCEGQRYISMEYVDGPDLLGVLVQASRLRVPIPAPLAIHIALHTCRALEYAHNAVAPDGEPLRLVHQDVSPSNILLSRMGNVKLSDFGLARAAATLVDDKRPAQVRGKLAYMAPELVLGICPDARADLFALGIVMFETLTLRRLFRARTIDDTLKNLRRMDVPAKLAAHDQIPEGARAIIERLLDRDREARYQSAGALRDDLEQLQYDLDGRVTDRDLQAFLGRLYANGPARAPVVRAESATTSASWSAPTSSPSPTPTPSNIQSEPVRQEPVREPVAAEDDSFTTATAGCLLGRHGLAGATGRLVVTHRDARKTIHFQQGTIVHVTGNDPSERLGPLLVRSQLATPRQLRVAMARRKEQPISDVALGQTLVQLGLLDVAALAQALTEQACGRIGTFLTWPGGRYQWFPDDRRGAERGALRLDPLTLLVRAARTNSAADVVARFRGIGNPRLTRARCWVRTIGELPLAPHEEQIAAQLSCPAITVPHCLRSYASGRLRDDAAAVIWLLFQVGMLRRAKGPADWCRNEVPR